MYTIARLMDSGMLREDNFKWSDRYGNYISIKEMDTRRLFCILLMIWNHIVPTEYRIWNNHRYVFDRNIYTQRFVVAAFINIFFELDSRSDIGFKNEKIFDKIKAFLHIMWNKDQQSIIFSESEAWL